MIIRHTLSLALLTALAGAAAPFDAHAEALAGYQAPTRSGGTAKAVAKMPFYVRHARGRNADVERDLRGNGGDITYYLDSVETFVVNLPEPAIAALANNPHVALLEPVPEQKLAAQTVPWNIDQFQARDVWDKNRDGNVDVGAPDGSGVKFCIIDTGFFYDIDGAGPDTGHSDFVGITASGVSQITGELWHFDGNGHGTHVAGTANAVNNTRGVVGVMPGGAELFIVKIFNNSGVWVNGQSNLGAAAQACRDNGANVISMSLGGGFSATEQTIFQQLYDNNNIVSIAAAGNDGNDVQSYPAGYPSVISVGAIDQAEVAAEFTQTPVPPASNNPANPPANVEWNATELAGGGVNVLSTWPTPNGEIPVYSVTSGGPALEAIHIESSGTTAAAGVSGNLVNGGLCLAGSGDATWNNAIVLCERGSVSFSTKVNAAAARNARAAVIYNNAAGNFNGTCLNGATDECTSAMPAVSLSQADGQALLATRLGQSTTVIAWDGTPCVGCSGGYNTISGTSMATPGVAAGVGFTWDACGGPTSITNKQLRQLLRDTARDLTGTQAADPTVTGDTPIVYGAGYDRVTGFGLVQLADALELGNARFGSACPLGLVATPAVRDICTLNSTSTTFNLTLNAQFTGASTLSATGAPAGSAGNFSPNPVVHPTKTSVYTLSNLGGVAAGSYPIDLRAVDNANPNNLGTASVNLNVTTALPGTTTLVSPANGATNLATTPTLSWQAVSGATSYLVQVATDAGFGSVVYSANVSGTSHTVATALTINTQYFWRVTPSNFCGTSTPPVASFTTENVICRTPNVAIPDRAMGTNGTVSDTLNIPAGATLTDLNVSLGITHTYVGDLSVSLRHVPTNKTVIMVDRPGVPASANGCSGNNISATLDDEAAAAVETQCAGTTPTVSGTFTPNNALSAFDGDSLSGDWVLTVTDAGNGDTGTLGNWCLRPTTGTPNAAPVAVADSIAVNEGATATTLVGGATSVRANDTDAEDGTPTGNVVQVAGPVNGALTLNANGTFSYVHNGSETTSDSFTYNVRDSAGAVSNTVTVSIAIAAQNDAPVAVADAITVAEGGTATALVGGATSVRSNDTDAEDTTPTGNVVQVAAPANGSLTLNANGTFSYVHNGGETTTDSFTYNVRDAAGAISNTATVSITITPQNDAPVAVADAITVAEGGTATTLVGGNTSVRQNDTDAESGTPTGNVVQVAGPANGSLTLNTNGTFSYVHNGGETTSDSFTYNVRDAAGAISNTATVSITITPQNDAPVAVADAISVAEGGTATTLVGGNTSVRQNDTDAEDTSPTGNVVQVAAPANGSLTLNTNGTFSYAHNGGETTTDSFTYNVRDAVGAVSNTATVSITISGVNDAPAAVGSIANRSDAEGAVVTQATAANFTDADGNTLTYSASGLPTGLSINASTGVISGTLAFTANAGSPFSVVVTATDPGTATATQAFTWTVTNTNRAPNAVGSIGNRSDAEGTVVSQATAANFADADSDTLSYSATGLPTGLSINASTGVISGTLAFTANAGSPFSVVVTATDPSTATATQAFTWTVTNTNRAPTSVGTIGNRSDAEGAVVSQATAANFADADSDTLSYSASGLPTGLTINSSTGVISGTLAFTANAGSPYSVVVTATDPSTATATQAFTWTVTNTNRAPNAVGSIGNRSDAEGAVVSQATAANFADADSDTLSYSASGLPTGLSINASTGVISGTLAFTANAGSPFSVVVTATDPSTATATQAFTWTVNNTNRAPSGVGTIGNRSDAEGDTVTQNTAANFADADSDTLSYSATGLPTGLSINASTGVISGTLAFTANAGSPFSVVVTATDPSNATATQAFTWTVSNTNRAPAATGTIANRSDAEGTLVSQATAANFTDVDSDVLVYSAANLPTGLSIDPFSGIISGTLSFTANAGSPFSVVVTATDPSNATATQAFTWTVTNANQAPVAVGTISSRSDAEGAVVSQATAANFADADGDTLSYSASGLPTGLSINATSGVISGTLAFTANAGSPFSVVVTATDPGTSTATQAFTWTVTNTNRAPGQVGSISNRSDAEGDTVTQNTATNFADADSDTLSYSASGLPTGLSINASTGVISGTLAFTANAGSPYPVVVTATDPSNATATQAFTWTVTNTNQAPAANGTIADRSDAEGDVVSQATAARFSDPDGDTLTYSGGIL